MNADTGREGGFREVAEAIRYVVDALVRGDVEAVATLTQSQRLPADEIREALLVVEEPLVMLEASVIQSLAQRCVGQLNGGSTQCWLDVDLPTRHGLSDLTLELTVLLDHGAARVEIDNLHVL